MESAAPRPTPARAGGFQSRQTPAPSAAAAPDRRSVGSPFQSELNTASLQRRIGAEEGDRRDRERGPALFLEKGDVVAVRRPRREHHVAGARHDAEPPLLVDQHEAILVIDECNRAAPGWSPAKRDAALRLVGHPSANLDAE